MKRVLQEITNNINQYSHTRYTIILMELLMYKYNFYAYCLKINIINNKVIPIKRLDDIIAGHTFARRGESMIKLISEMLEWYTCPDCTLYLSIDDKYLFYDVPILTYAKPPSKKGILIPDHTFIDAEPENMAIPRYISIDDIKEKMNERMGGIGIGIGTGQGIGIGKGTGQGKGIGKGTGQGKGKRKKIEELFFIGQDIALISNNTNLRKYLSNQPKPFNVILDKYMPMATFCDYAYLLNISGAWAWSFRFKFLFLTKSLVINVACFWVQVFDALFIPGVDYIDIMPGDMSLIKSNILTAINSENISAIAKSGYKKGKLLTLKRACYVLHYTIMKWCKKFNNGRNGRNGRNGNQAESIFLKRYKLEINNMDAYREIKFYDTLEKEGHGDLLVPLLDFYIKDDTLHCIYALAEVITVITPKIHKRLKHIYSIIKSLGILIPKGINTVLRYNNQYYLSGFKKYICREDINSDVA